MLGSLYVSKAWTKYGRRGTTRTVHMVYAEAPVSDLVMGADPTLARLSEDALRAE